jgi:hypothetical protein
VRRDDAEAFKWYLKAAEQGLKAAQYRVGLMFALGRGVPQDFSVAMKWNRKAADQGYDKAQANLWFMRPNN